jgi:ABC-type protease/lipase transport system fused ATPase/permease subunit
LRKKECIVVLVSHRPDAIAALNIAMVLYEGRMIAFGPRDEIFARVARPAANAPAVKSATAKPATPLKPKTAESLARATGGAPP